MSQNKTVVVAMSGGVDSSVAALLLKQQHYNCIGITMKLWDYEQVGGNINHESGCCSLDSINDARMVCAKLDIPHYVVNFSKQFHNEVVDNFVDEYLAGRTPNPCVLCNTKIKWEALIKRALELGADYIATGHYAKVSLNKETGRYELCTSAYRKKDQSYALWGISQENLARTLFPLADLTKQEVRKLAEEHELRTAKKSESMEICFVADNNYKRFLTDMVEGLEQELAHGKLTTTGGTVVGEQPGYPFFTIGQRRGIGKGFNKRMYVVDVDPNENKVIIGEEWELYSESFIARDVNLIGVADLGNGIHGIVKIRYNDSGTPATIYPLPEGRVRVVFDQPQKAVTPGQSAVFYKEDCVLGGGIIESFKRIRAPQTTEV